MLMIYGWLLVCACIDAREQRVPNALTLPFMALALLQLAVYQTTLTGAPARHGLLAAGVALLLTLPGFILNRLGGGDVKLLLALGLASSPGLVLGSFVYGTVALLIWAVLVWATKARSGRQTGHRDRAFAPSLFIGAVMAAWWPLLH